MGAQQRMTEEKKQEKQSREAGSRVIFSFVPPDARLVVERGHQVGAWREQYAAMQPAGRYIGIPVKTGGEEPSVCISPESVDCLVYGAGAAAGGQMEERLRQHAAWLRPGGQLLVLIPNRRYWRNLRYLLTGEPAGESLFGGGEDAGDMEAVRQAAIRAGLQVYSVQEAPAEDDRQEFAAFCQAVRPALTALGADPSEELPAMAAPWQVLRAVKEQRPVPRLLVQTMLLSTFCSDSIRVYEPDRCLQTIPGVRTISAVGTANLNLADQREEKVFVWQRQRLKYPKALDQQRELLRRGYLTVAEIDDDPLFWPEHGENQFITFRSSHCVQTSTEYLANLLRQYNPNVGVFPNQLAYLPPRRVYPPDKPVTLFFGAFNREADWEPIMSVLNRVLVRCRGRVQVQVVYDRKFFDALDCREKRFEPLCSYSRYHQILHSMDIGLLPLNPTRFNQAKSDLKFLQCAGHGVAVLASPTVYEQSVQDGATGMIYHDPDEFAAKLQQLIENSRLRQQLAGSAYQWVKNNRMLCQHYHDRYDWYRKMRRELPRLNEELAQRVPEMF